jgi:hypothetical protein
MPTGGHIDPISIVGAKLEWKKAQKKEKKNIISEIINKIIPIFNPICTVFVCFPKYKDSFTTSTHQKYIDTNKNVILKKNKEN